MLDKCGVDVEPVGWVACDIANFNNVLKRQHIAEVKGVYVSACLAKDSLRGEPHLCRLEEVGEVDGCVESVFNVRGEVREFLVQVKAKLVVRILFRDSGI